MKSNRPFEPDDQDLPEGWDPAAEVDSQLETIFRIAKESGAPAEEPRHAAVEALHMATRRQLFAERLIHSGADSKKNKSVGASLRALFFGGSAGAQFLRLGVTAGVALVIGANFVNQPALISEAKNKVTIDSADASPSSFSPPAPDPINSAASPAPVGDDVASMPEVPARGDGNRDTVQGVAIPRSVATDLENGWRSTASNSGQWMYGAGRTVSDEQYPPVAYDGQRSDLPSHAVDQIQYMKLNAMMKDDEGSLTNLRGLEETFAELMRQYDYNKQQPKMTALQQIQRADSVISSGRFRDGVDEFERVPQMAPGSPLALIAEFQVGRIAYEKLNEFEMAKESFQHCLDNYQGLSLTKDAQDYLRDRLNILKATEANDWESLRAWRDANRATTAKAAVASLLKVIETCDYPQLAADAAMRLRQYAIQKNTALDVDYESAQQVLVARLATLSSGQHTARMQFALADITLTRTDDLQLAKEQMQTAMKLGPDPDTLRLIQTRLNQIGARTASADLPATP